MEEGTFINDSVISSPFSPSAASFALKLHLPGRQWGVIVVSRPYAIVITGAIACPLHAGGQRLYYRSYKAEAAGHKALVTLVFHHGYVGATAGSMTKVRDKEMAERPSSRFYEWPDLMLEHCIHREVSIVKPLSTSCSQKFSAMQITGHCRKGASVYSRLMPTALANQSLLSQHTCARMC